jgi:hypothetical protein
MADPYFVLVISNEEGSHFKGVFSDEEIAEDARDDYNASVRSDAIRDYHEAKNTGGPLLFDTEEGYIDFSLRWYGVTMIPSQINKVHE